MSSLRMSPSEREAFLAEMRVGVISIEAEGRAPLAVPIWYDYEPGGDLWVITERASLKGRLLTAARRFSLCVQSEALPYKYVSVEGEVARIETAEVERDLRPMAHRYLGAEMGDLYVQQTATDATAGGSIVVRMHPRRWAAIDYTKEFSAAG